MKKVIVHEGLTKKHPDKDVYQKTYVGLEYDLSDGASEENIARTMIHMRRLIRQELGVAETPHIPEFNSEELMKHDWKGKKTGEGEYAKGSLGWGWDFRDKFSAETIHALEKTSPLVIGKYEFTLGDTLVNVKKKKGV